MRTEARIRAAFKATLGRFVLDAAFELPARGVIGLFGPSGCGKTSLLRCIAGLLRVPDGYFSIGDESWQDGAAFRPPHERPIGYVFQEPSLFAHLSVRNNLRFGMPRGRARGSAGTAGVRWDDVVALLGMEEWLERSPRHLSGGERQRVAIGRALLSEPRLLLLDEPLSALDQRAKGEILPLLERLHRALSIPVLYVSHDMTELERFADQLVLMDAGRVVAAGPLPSLACDPDLPLLRARDAAVSLEALVEGYDSAYGLLALRVGGARFLVPAAPCRPGERRRLRVRAEDVSLALERPTGSSIINVLPARILSVSGLGTNEITLVLGLDGAQGEEDPVDGGSAPARLLSRVTRRSWEQLQLAEGRAVFAQVKSVALAPQPPR